MIKIHGMQDSGNCYKPRLLMALAGRPFQHVEISTRDGSTRTPSYLALNPAGQAPLLELEDGRTLSESNAILCFLGEGTQFVPQDPFLKARMLQWMFFEQYSHEPYVAVRRSLLRYPERRAQASEERLQTTLQRGNAALAVMETQLAAEEFLAGSEPSLADIALFAYTHLAGQGGFDLEAFPAVLAWTDRIAALPGFQPLTWLPPRS